MTLSILAVAAMTSTGAGSREWDFQADAIDASPAGLTFARTGGGRDVGARRARD